MVPMNEDQKEHCVQMCQIMKKRLQTESELFGEVITVDEIWLFEYDTKTKQQNNQWKSSTFSRRKKARQRQKSVMSITCFDMRGIVHTEILP